MLSVVENGLDRWAAIQAIKGKLVVSTKALQKQYVSMDTVALAKTEMPTPCAVPWRPCLSTACMPSTLWGGTGQDKKDAHQQPLPRPVSGPLLKAVTHKHVISGSEHLILVCRDTGHCQALSHS